MLRDVRMAAAACLLMSCTMLAAAQEAPITASVDAQKKDITLNVTKDGKMAEDPNEQTVLDAIKLMKEGKLKAAIEPLTEIINKHEAQYADGKVQIYSAHGMADALMYASLGTKDPSRQTLVLGPSVARAYWARGYIYGEMNQFDDEIRDLHKATALAPLDPQYAVELAYAYQQKGDFQKSLEIYTSAEDMAEFAEDPGMTNHFKCYALRGQGYDLVELHRLDEAETRYKACLKLTPDEPKSLGELEYIKQLRAKK